MCTFRHFDAVLCNFGTILFLFLCTLKTYSSAAFVSGVIPVSVKHNDPMWCGWGGINNKINVLTRFFIVRVTMAWILFSAFLLSAVAPRACTLDTQAQEGGGVGEDYVQKNDGKHGWCSSEWEGRKVWHECKSAVRESWKSQHYLKLSRAQPGFSWM